MDNSAAKLPPLPDQEPEISEQEVVEDIAIPEQEASARRRPDFNLSAFPEKIEQFSQSSLVFILLGIFGFVCGAGLMIWMLQ